jgi:hypothetical protein
LKFTAKSKQELASAHPEMNKWILAVSRSEMRHFSARSRKPGTRAKRGESKRSADKSRDCAETYILYVAPVK